MEKKPYEAWWKVHGPSWAGVRAVALHASEVDKRYPSGWPEGCEVTEEEYLQMKAAFLAYPIGYQIDGVRK
jgi:hypothetical protein